MSFLERFLRPTFTETKWTFRTLPEEYDEVEFYYYLKGSTATEFEGAPNSYDDPWNCYRKDRVDIASDLYETLQRLEANSISFENALFAMNDKKIEKLGNALDWTEVTPEQLLERLFTQGEGGANLETIRDTIPTFKEKLEEYTTPAPSLALRVIDVIELKLAHARRLGHDLDMTEDLKRQLEVETLEEAKTLFFTEFTSEKY